MEKLDKIFNPKTIAVIGATDTKGSVGKALMDNLTQNKFKGKIYPVNIKRKTVQNIKAYQSIKDISEQIDLAIIATPAKTVPDIIKECGQAGVSGVIIISAGFKETGKEGEVISNKILKIAREYNMRIIGPNCLGFIRPKIKLNASFANQMALDGKIAFISQSGALCTAILDWSVKNNVGFSHFVSIGSMLDVNLADLIDYFSNDPEISSLLIYMESLEEARTFLSAARAFSRTKPIIVLKAGRSKEGAKAARTHTGNLAGNDAAFDAAFERAGIIRVDTTVALFHVAKSLAMQPKPQGNRMAIITNAGGPGIIATDSLIYANGQIARLEKTTINELNKFLPSAWSHNNPVDILGDADPKRYKRTLEICMKDKNVDAVLVILTPQAMTNPAAVAQELVTITKANQTNKTILASWMGGYEVEQGRRILEKGNIPIYRQPEDAVECFTYLYHYSRNLELLYETPATIPHAFNPQTEKNKDLIKKVIQEKREVLTEVEAKELLKNYDIPVTNQVIASTSQKAGILAEKIGFPVVMKILSPDIEHKTDAKAVHLNIKSRKEAEKAFQKIINSVSKFATDATIQGVMIESMIKKRYELLIGSKKDAIFGPIIIFGMGGVAVEVFNDIEIGLPPLNMALSLRMIKETKIYKLLKGYRGMPGVDIPAIQFLLYKFAYLVADFPEVKEIDINPLAIDEHGGIVLDAKVILDKSVIGKKIKPYSHLVISPYPKEHIADFTMKNKKKVTLRPIKPEDELLKAELFKTFSRETQKHRFFKQIKDISHELLIRYTQIDYDREISIIAELSEQGKKKMIGVVRLITDPYNKTAEFAVVVGDPWQFQGLGKKLTDFILIIAQKQNIKKIYAKFLLDNQPMINIFKKRDFKISKKQGMGYAEKIL